MLLHINFMNRILLLLLFNTVCITSFAQALEDANVLFEEGCKFYDQKDTVNAFKSFQKASELGDSQAQTSLAIMYEKGEGVPQDYNKAIYWYQKAADQGNVYAQNNLAVMYENGYGVERSILEAAILYREAAEGGVANAQYGLAWIYENERGFSLDYSRAVYWYQKAAEQGYLQAQFNLALMYGKGDGVPQDYNKAIYWYKKAAEQGDSYAQNNLAIMYVNGNGVTQDYGKALYWFQKSAEQGHVDAQFNLALMYENGEGVPQDYSKAIYWYQKAAEQGFPQAQINLGAMYENEKGVPRDYSKAAYWYQKAAEQGNDYAQNKLGEMYENERGVPRDYNKAIYWYKKAAEQREQKAVEKLISIYENGIGVPKDIEQAEYWRKKSDFVPLEGDDLRIALIIGISDYNPRLENTEKDAHALHNALSNLHFVVETCINKEHDEMKKAIADFCEKAKEYGVAMIYYAGHAVQERGINYLIPARSETPIDYDDMKKKYISLSSVIDSLQKANVRKNIIIMDACRDSPEYAWRTRGGKKGLAPVDEPKHFLIAFSTQAGEIAEDGTGQNNSPYMTAFLEELKKPRQDIDAVMINVREKVIEMTNEKQIPFYKNNLEETEKKFFFNRSFNWN